MDKTSREYGKARRQVEILKLRGTPYSEGAHDYSIVTGGVVVFPRLIAADSRNGGTIECVSSGIPELDALTGGGLDRGTATLLIGPAGCGKTTIATHWVVSAAERGETCAVFTFEEGPQTLMRRAARLGIDPPPPTKNAPLSLQPSYPPPLS